MITEQTLKNEYEILDKLTETAFSFIPSYLEFLERAKTQNRNMAVVEQDAVSFNVYMREMRARVTEDLSVIDTEYFPPGLKSRGFNRIKQTLQPVLESKLSTERHPSQQRSVDGTAMKHSSVRHSPVPEFA
jgi:hypothetical protein